MYVQFFVMHPACHNLLYGERAVFVIDLDF